MKLSNQFRRPPAYPVVRITWFYQAEHAGQSIKITDGQLFLPADTREVRVHGRIRPATPDISYDQTVESYKKEYKVRYEEFLQTGVTNRN